jgi:hypothetical protein
MAGSVQRPPHLANAVDAVVRLEHFGDHRPQPRPSVNARADGGLDLAA